MSGCTTDLDLACPFGLVRGHLSLPNENFFRTFGRTSKCEGAGGSFFVNELRRQEIIEWVSRRILTSLAYFHISSMGYMRESSACIQGQPERPAIF